MNDSGPVFRAFEARIDDVNKTERSLVARINTADIDRLNSVIDPRGVDVDDYNKVVDWMHGKDPTRGSLPVATCRWLYKMPKDDPTELRAKTQFLKDEFSQQIYEWYRDETLRDFSISAIPDWDHCGPATPAEIKAKPALGRGYFSEHGGGPGVFMYRRTKLVGYSAVSFGGNPACTVTTERASRLMECVKRGLYIPEPDLTELRSIATSTDATLGPEPEPEERPAPLQRTTPYIETDGQTWTVYAPSGQPIIGFSDAGTAELCLADMNRATGVDVGGLMIRRHRELDEKFAILRADRDAEERLWREGKVS
jgi:hypothetical protein